MDWICVCDICEEEIDLMKGEAQYLLRDYVLCEKCFENEQ
jgi:hypothetical protein